VSLYHQQNRLSATNAMPNPDVHPTRPFSVQSAALLTLDQVAGQLGVSKAWVRDHATRRNPRIPVVRLGGKRALLRFRPQDVEQFISRHLVSEERGV
jgi:predicted DNA-binding transcriptional regulator AlpA